MTIVNIVVGYLLEILVSFVYFEKKFTPKITKKYVRILLYVLSFFIVFGVNFIGIPNINLAAFVVCNIALCCFCYDTKLVFAVFNSILLASLLIVTELFVYYLAQFAYWSGVEAIIPNEYFVMIQNIIIKLIYFIIVGLILILSSKEKNIAFKFTMSTFLFLLPVASILVLVGIVRITEIYATDSYLYAVFGVAALILLYAYIVVFGVYESIIKTQKENTQLQLQQQRSEIDTEYYNILQEQYENSNILIHDIKRHLMSIKELSDEKDFDGINKYIDNLYGEYQIKYLRKYSSNQLVNAIVNRYAAFCRDNGIDFYCDIRDIDFSFMTENNLTAILDNLLENATEAAKYADKKTVEIKILPTNVNYVTINIWNTCSAEPMLKEGKLLSHKKDSSIHGLGLKIVERIANEYDGNTDFSFDGDKMVFTLSVVLKSK